MLTIISLILLIIILLAIILIVFTPYPSALIVKKLFEGGVAVKPDDYDNIKRQTVHHENISSMNLAFLKINSMSFHQRIVMSYFPSFCGCTAALMLRAINPTLRNTRCRLRQTAIILSI